MNAKQLAQKNVNELNETLGLTSSLLTINIIREMTIHQLNENHAIGGNLIVISKFIEAKMAILRLDLDSEISELKKELEDIKSRQKQSIGDINTGDNTVVVTQSSVNSEKNVSPESPEQKLELLHHEIKKTQCRNCRIEPWRQPK